MTEVSRHGSPQIPDRNKFSSTSGKNGWAFGGGDFWQLVNALWINDVSYGGASFDDVALVDQNNGWAVGSGTVWKLENGTWSFAPSIANYESFDSMALLDANTSWASVSTGTTGCVIYKIEKGEWLTYDGDGNGVITDSGLMENRIISIELVDYSNGWAVADNMMISQLSPNE